MAKNMDLAKKILKKGYLLIGLLIFVWVIRDLNFQQLKAGFLSANIPYFLAAVALYLPINIVKSYRWKKIMDTQGIHYSLKDSFLMLGAGAMLALITPGKIGDLSKITFLMRDKHSFARAFLGNILDKLFDLLFVFIFALAALPFLNLPFHIYFGYATVLKWIAVIVAVLIVLLVLFYMRNRAKVKTVALEIWNDIKKFKPGNILYILTITSASWLIFFILIYLIAVSINLNHQINFLYISFAATLGILAAFIPISIIGMGTREASFLFLLLPLGIPKETIILFSLLIALSYVGPYAIGLYCWIKKPFILPNA